MTAKGKPKRILPDIEIGSKVLPKDSEPKEESPSLVDLTLSLNPYPAKLKPKKKQLR